jgi:hypothetical protein
MRNGRRLGWALSLAGVDNVVIEDVAARPGQGVSSMFKFGRTLGFAHAIVLGIRPRPAVRFTTPGQWKAKLGLLNSSKAPAVKRLSRYARAPRVDSFA